MQGDEADAFYILVHGEVTLANGSTPLYTLSPTTFIGEIALLFDCPRCYSVTSNVPSALLMLPKVRKSLPAPR
jgi:CRP-like cAMP-binding protein